MKIPSPNAAPGGSNADCQHALDAAFKSIVADAENAGWSRAEVAVALRELAEAHVIDLVSEGADAEEEVGAVLESSQMGYFSKKSTI